MKYEYDVFISYRRKETCKWWVENRFLPLFKEKLEEAVGGRRVEIFFDQSEIEGGDAWKMKLKRALACSKCLVPILMPSYFHSEWCTTEFAIIHNRQKKLGYNTIENPSGLIVPIQVNDGKYFPECVNELEMWKFHSYFKKGTYFEETQRFYEFQDRLDDLVQNIANILDNIPNWKTEWLEDEYLEISNEEFFIANSPTMNPPTL